MRIGAALVALVSSLVGPLIGSRAAEASSFDYLSSGSMGRTRCLPSGEPPPGGWQDVDFDDSTWGPPDGGLAGCEVLRARRHFTVADERSRLAALDLQISYRDGFVAFLNGVEVARRRLLDGGALAIDPHGGEAEHFFVPVTPAMLRAGDNVLAVEVRPYRVGRSPSVDTSLSGGDAPRIVRGPYLVHVGVDEAKLIVETDLPTKVEVRWGLAGKPLARRAVSDKIDTRHPIVLVGTLPGHTYRYRVYAQEPGGGPAAATVEAAFHTPPTASHPLRFVVMGDVRSGHDIHAEIVKRVAAEDPDLILGTGDLVETGGDDAEWQRYFSIEASLLAQVPMYSAMGNHDHARRDEGLARFLSLWDHPAGATWWSFDVSGVHFVLLDSDQYKDAAQLEWLKADLAAARQRKVRAMFACVHHGPWSSGLHGDNPLAIAQYAPVLDAGGVTVLFAGHDHHYERGKVGNLNYFISGGGGAELRPAHCGVAGKRRCPPRVKAFYNEHHYIVVDLQKDRARICAKRPDGTPLEDCVTVPLRK